MKFTKIATVLGLTAVCVPTMAQYEGTRVYDRIGHGQDSILQRQLQSPGLRRGIRALESRVHDGSVRRSEHVCLWCHDSGQRTGQRAGHDEEKGILQRIDELI